MTSSQKLNVNQDTCYLIEHTNKEDLRSIYSLFEEAIDYQKRNHYPVWKGYDKKVISNDIEKGLQFKLTIDGAIAFFFSLCHSDKIIWGGKDDNSAVYIHRMVVNPKFKGKQLFFISLDWIKQYAKDYELNFIRMDTWADNPNLIAYYQKFGFTVVDRITTPDSDELPFPQRNNNIVLLEYVL